MIEWEYGVAHVERGEVMETVACWDLDAAKRLVTDCSEVDAAECYVVRRPARVEWQPL